ncbi:cytochrome c [Methylobrevis pamukkalensis]|uniref:Fructose dehydrogenase cytochrome subunit n=1 Tax=Methylobrevis pamukkalensis TaxID=1439726 RepID=A0A1E3HAE9_9HYPH|nr:cytochrome c [Methylobrevis pamukkalensis]ODN72451.1 Fructose dehydrogenase cytochrome subunit precursor [Methylobrevis pamukkalensis]
MWRKLVAAAIALTVAGGAGFWLLTRPVVLAASDLPAHVADLANGERMFHAGSCASCHAAPGAVGADKTRLGGGLDLRTDFGLFRVPNISPDPDTGIGRWTAAEFATAMLHGVGPDGRHLYPAFPYTSYARMTLPDVLDLGAYLRTLPPVTNTVPGHDLAFPFSVRRGIGLWKRRYLDPSPVLAIAADNDLLARGRYLVEGPGHCGECHTPRDAFGGPDRTRWLAGAPDPEGKGRIPNITPHDEGIGGWAEEDIAYALESGFTPDFDTFGGSMVAVQENFAALGAGDRAAVAAYLKAVPALADAR